MPELYIGNVSKQIQMFAYRTPEKSGLVTQPIPIGGQIRISPNGANSDLSTPEIDAIVGQHKMYGLISIDNLEDRSSPFSGLVYSIGKPLSVDKLRKAMHKNEEMLQALGRKMRQEAALAVNSQIEEQIGAPLRQLEMSFTEVEPKSGYNEDLDHLAEGIRVTRSQDSSSVAELGSRRSRR